METNKRVLVVDDETACRELVRLILEPLGYAVSEAVNGTSAVGLLSETEFDGIILDLHMPGGRGEMVIEWMLAHRPDQCRRVLVVSADPDSYGRNVLLTRIGIPFLAKPFELRQFESAVERLVAA